MTHIDEETQQVIDLAAEYDGPGLQYWTATLSDGSQVPVYTSQEGAEALAVAGWTINPESLDD